MKQILIPFIIAALTFSCNPKPQAPTSVLAADTVRVIDTTIIEDGPEPVAKNARVKPEHPGKRTKISCTFGHKRFNQRKRPIEEAPGGVKGKPTKPGSGGGGSTEPPPPTGTGGTIYLDFWGGTVSGTMWNTSGSFTVADAGLSQVEIDGILYSVGQHYLPYNVTVTNDINVFNATAIGKRIRIIVTESWEWFGQAGGVAYLGSFFWSDGSPAFVFSKLLNYNPHYISEAAAHEAGHTIYLRHQSDCTDGVVTNQYSYGKTMGVSYYVPLGAWVTGTSSIACAIQNDDAMITNAVGKR